MNKEKIGTHFIGEGTVITDNKTHLQYVVIQTNSRGIKQRSISTITPTVEIFNTYDQIENAFNNSDISISGYEISDSKILHLIINALKKDNGTGIIQIKKTGSVSVKKKVKKINSMQGFAV